MGLLNLFRGKKEPSNDHGLFELKRQEKLGAALDSAIATRQDEGFFLRSTRAIIG